VRLEHAPSPITPICRATRISGSRCYDGGECAAARADGSGAMATSLRSPVISGIRVY
jgi:hypothetical protein